MNIYCALSCDTCPLPVERTPEENQLLQEVAAYGMPQRVEGAESAKTFDVIRKTVDYMKNVVHVENSAVNLKKEIVDECTNKEGCEFIYI